MWFNNVKQTLFLNLITNKHAQKLPGAPLFTYNLTLYAALSSENKTTKIKFNSKLNLLK